MRVTVEYMTQVRRTVGRADETFDWPGGTLADLVRLIALKHPVAESLLVDAAGAPSRAVLFFVDDEPAGAGAPIPKSARVTIMTPMAGGAGV